MERSIRFSSKATLRSMQCKLGIHICKETLTKLKRVQRRATRIPTGFKKFEHEDRLKKLSMTKLKDKRIKGYLIEMYKVMCRREGIDWLKP